MNLNIKADISCNCHIKFIKTFYIVFIFEFNNHIVPSSRERRVAS